ncbi:MAG: hypothetical protein CMD03_00160 [Flavobacteriales bacterium]|nr:hypothetical protein [Flavobacteriales bacterium]
MKNQFLSFLTFFLLFIATSIQAQIKSKVWYDGNARVMYDRNVLAGSNLDQTDTVSSRSTGQGFSKIDLGIHFTPVKDIEINSSIRLQNDFGGMWGNRNTVALRSLSATGVIKNKIRFSVGDLFLNQSKYTLYNYSQELAKYEPSVFNFYREYINYENYYIKNYWRLQGIQTNFSYNMYKFIEQIDLDIFSSRVRGSQWLGDPELLMIGGTTFIRLNKNFKIGSHYINTFEVMSSSNTNVAYYNPVITAKIIYSDKIYEKYPYSLIFEGGLSQRGWRGDEFAPETNGSFFSSSFKSKIKSSNVSLSFRYVDTDFRSIGSQSRRIHYSLTPTSYPFYNNNFTQRKISLLDIVSDPNIYNQKLSTSLMNYNPMYSATMPYGDATPNRIGAEINIEDINVTYFLKLNLDAKYFTEISGQGTREKRDFLNGVIYSKLFLNKIFDLNRPIIIETSFNSENVKRAGSAIEKISLNNHLLSGGVSIGIIENLNLICGAKMFSSKGNEYLIERNKYDEIIDYDKVTYANEEKIVIAGLQYYFEKDTYITLQFNHFNVLDVDNVKDEFSMKRLVFMFNMNL